MLALEAVHGVELDGLDVVEGTAILDLLEVKEGHHVEALFDLGLLHADGDDLLTFELIGSDELAEFLGVLVGRGALKVLGEDFLRFTLHIVEVCVCLFDVLS